MFKGNITYSLGFTALAAGFALLTAPVSADASDFDNEVLTIGSENDNEEVEQLQEILNDKGYLDESNVTGDYDEATSEAVAGYQEDHSLLSDGVAGTQTLGALSALAIEDEGVLVEELQSELQNQGYDPKHVDGKFGPLTEEAVEQFQSDAGIAVDGIAGAQTFGELMFNDSVKHNEDNEEADVVEEEATSEPSEEANEESSEETASESAEASEQTEASEQSESSSNNEAPEGATMSMEATAYTAECEGCTGITATGIDLNNDRNANVVAVDPNVIPLGSTVYVEGYGEAIAGDTGGAINGNKIDLHMATQEEALNFGRQTVEVTVLD